MNVTATRRERRPWGGGWIAGGGAGGALALWLLLTAAPAWGSPAWNGLGLSGQPGVVRTLAGYPSAPGTWSVAAIGSYGWHPDVLVDGDVEHSSWGRLVLAYAPWEFFQVAASLDQSISNYTWPDGSRSLVSGAVGDPRVTLRTGWAVGRGFSLGAQLGVWFPSGFGSFNAVGRAISPSLDGMLSFTPGRLPLGVHLQVGYLHNRTRELLRELGSVSEQSLALSGLTATMHHVQLGLAFEYRLGPAAPYVELSADLPVGGRGLAHSWLVVGVGSRFWLGPRDALQLLVGLEFRAVHGSPDPDPASNAVWEDPPLIGATLGVSARSPARREPAGQAQGGAEGGAGQEPPAVAAPAEAEEEAAGRISGRVLCQDGPCGRGITVEVEGSGASPFAVDADQGTFVSTELRPGSYQLVASGEGLAAQTQQVVVAAGATAETSFSLTETVGIATGIRGRVTDFSGAPLRARVRIPALDAEVESGPDGQFEVEAPPGVYQVMIWAQGHQTQTTSVEVTRRGMVVMNVELR